MSAVIKVENLSKIYKLGETGTGSFSKDFQRWVTTKILRKEDPYLTIGEENDRTKLGGADVVYSLRDVSFEVEQGASLAIVGRNGAGKSTLLKVLSRITSPTIGKVSIKGRISSLLEVGTGFHPDLSGKENIFINGAILGMRKKEIARKLDEIIEFSGIGRYIDTPVKRYSSGMYVRLAFAVAAHLEGEILILDEVLSVGDAEFQKKCLGKMGDVQKADGRTVIFVSHNLFSIKSFCKEGIMLRNGQIAKTGDIDLVVSEYLGGFNGGFAHFHKFDIEEQGLKLNSIGICNSDAGFSDVIVRNKEIKVEIAYTNLSKYEKIYFVLKVKDDDGKYIFTTNSYKLWDLVTFGEGKAFMTFPGGYFNDGNYVFDIVVLGFVDNKQETIFIQNDCLRVQILPDQKALGAWMGREVGYIRPVFEWGGKNQF
jgi:lipopolysaccharide transport system ATP-binding protein